MHILAERQGDSIWSGTLMKDGTKVCTLQGFALSDSGPSPLDLYAYILKYNILFIIHYNILDPLF